METTLVAAPLVLPPVAEALADELVDEGVEVALSEAVDEVASSLVLKTVLMSVGSLNGEPLPAKLMLPSGSMTSSFWPRKARV